MSKLELILLGHFDCLLPSGQRISLSMRKAEVLLAYLALVPGIRHPRERLINLLWSDRGEEQARNSLRQCLSAIKKSLGDGADLILLVDRSAVTLKPELIDVDVHEFEHLAASDDFESLTTAVELYQGEFLEGITLRDASGQEWLDSQRGRFKHQFIEVLLNLTQTQLLSHDFSTAIKSSERLVKQDPLGESGWRLLMRSYFENGDRSHALQAYKRCQNVLRDELDVDPEAETAQLRDRIANGGTSPAPKAVPKKASVDTPPTTDHSIAVLPFDNLSGDPEQEYFSDGITDSIILNLSRFPGLHVKSRNSSFAFKQQIKSLGEISQELKVDYIVEGSIRKSLDRIRITVQLIETTNGNQVWGKRYDARIEDLLELEEELSRKIAATVTGRIESDLQRIAITKSAAHQQAYDFLLGGIYHLNRTTSTDVPIAIDLLNQCLAQDPDNVRAHVGLYNCHAMTWMDRWIADYQSSFELARIHANKALALNDDFGQGVYVYGELMMFCRDYEKAATCLDKALAINPNNPNYLTAKAMNHTMQGDFEVALKLAEQAYHLDPYNWWADWNLAEAQYQCKQYQQALETIDASKNAPGAIRIYSVAAFVKLGQLDAARQALQIYLQECRESMLVMPQTREEWLHYNSDTAPYQDPSYNQDIIDCMVQAGLDDSMRSPQQENDSSQQPSILVLPFSNLSGDPEQEYFSDGISESIILNLSSFSGLEVKSRHTSFAFKDNSK
ncbi:MAG: tetratricopeptide repeat protein, partial [Gammaproteobacteria bacterium]|nr:tetratricopeptide repeat protein [Gammaproteobacteria bacterium]